LKVVAWKARVVVVGFAGGAIEKVRSQDSSVLQSLISREDSNELSTS